MAIVQRKFFLKKKSENEKELQEWFTVFPDLDDKETDFICWLKEEKSEDIENFADPQWVREKIATGEFDLDGLRKEYQDYQTEVKIEMEEKAEVIDLEDRNSFSTGRSNSSRKRTISTTQENKSTPKTNELVDSSHQEEKLETQVQIPPKQKY